MRAVSELFTTTITPAASTSNFLGNLTADGPYSSLTYQNFANLVFLSSQQLTATNRSTLNVYGLPTNLPNDNLTLDAKVVPGSGAVTCAGVAASVKLPPTARFSSR